MRKKLYLLMKFVQCKSFAFNLSAFLKCHQRWQLIAIMIVLTDSLIYRGGFAYQADNEIEIMSVVLLCSIIFAFLYTYIRIFMISRIQFLLSRKVKKSDASSTVQNRFRHVSASEKSFDRNEVRMLK